MKLFLLLLCSSLAGVGLGLGVTYAKYGLPSHALEGASEGTLPALSAALQPSAPGGPQPVAKPDAEEHDFGNVERNQLAKHSFYITNDGKHPLNLEKGGTTCGRCTISELSKTTAQPGESIEVSIQYDAHIKQDEFRQSATILTNDPHRPRLTFTVSGKIVSSYRLSPEELVLSKVGLQETKTTDVQLLAYVADDLQITGSELLEASTAPYFEVAIEPLAREQLSDAQAHSGVLVRVKIKPGLPLGPFRQRIRLATNLPDRPNIELPVEGSIASDISLVGRGWDSHRFTLSFGTVQSAEGAKRTLMLIARGADRQNVRFTVASVTPGFVKVSLGESNQASDVLTQTPLTVEIPPGSPAQSYSGLHEGEEPGRIVLKTTHPLVPEITLRISFAVE